MKKVTMFGMFLGALVLSLFTTSCAGGGLFIIPLFTIGGAAIFGYKAYKSSKSGSFIVEEGAVTDKEGGNIPLYKLGYFWFSLILAVASILILIGFSSDK